MKMPAKTSVFARHMVGATASYKAHLQRNVTPAVFADVVRLSGQILESLPKDAPLGTLTAAVMLAATAFAENAAQARRLIETRTDGDGG